MMTCDKCPCDAFAEEKFFFCKRLDRKMYRSQAGLCRTNDAYRAFYTGTPKQSSAKRPSLPTEGPGTELLKMLKAPVMILGFLLRIDMDDCDCRAYARKMNAWGVAGCRKRLDEITNHLQSTAKRKKLPFNRLAAKELVELAIERAERKSCGQTCKEIRKEIPPPAAGTRGV